MRHFTLLIIPAVLLLLLVTGCERKVVNEYATPAQPGGTAVCFTCHSDTDLMLVEARDEYDESVHGTGHTYNENRNNSSFYSSCEGCHTSEGFVARMTGVPYEGDQFTRISCFTCHQPHTSGTLALRTTDAVTLGDGTNYDNGASNLCVECHRGRRDVNTYVYDDDTLSTHFGPHHGPQGDMLMGANAYEYDGFTYTKFHAHSTATDGCLHCHMESKPLYATGGHSFNMANEEEDYDNVSGCNNGCHNGGVESFDHADLQTDVETLLDSLETLLLDAGLLEEVDEDGVISIDPTDGLVVSTADSVGAVFNYMYVKEDRSMGIHNPNYSIDLLESSIEFMNGEIPAKSPKAAGEPVAIH